VDVRVGRLVGFCSFDIPRRKRECWRGQYGRTSGRSLERVWEKGRTNDPQGVGDELCVQGKD
jgi:hypothetical protein